MFHKDTISNNLNKIICFFFLACTSLLAQYSTFCVVYLRYLNSLLLVAY